MVRNTKANKVQRTSLYERTKVTLAFYHYHHLIQNMHEMSKGLTLSKKAF